MKIFDLVSETYISLSGNKARSILTILGIVVGISSVIVMISVGTGAKKSIENNIQSIGSNLIMVQPGGSRSSSGGAVFTGRGNAKTLTESDLEAVKTEVSGIEALAGKTSGRYQIVTKGGNTNTQVIGTTTEYATIHNMEIVSGEFINDKQEKSMTRVAVIGPTTAEDLFGEDVDPVDKVVRINGIEFKIIGMTKAKGGSGFNNQDDMLIVPLSTAQKLLSGSSYLGGIDIKAMTTDVMSQVQTDVTSVLLDRHNKTADTADFSVMNQSDIMETASSVAGTFTTLLAAIAGISLVVGGIGIMNMMLTTVTERTKEIGLRKAIGAKGHDISTQFLVESMALTTVGGLVGITVGVAVSVILSSLNVITTAISAESILLSFGVSAFIGIVFGYYPAKRASNLNPIDALRFE